MMHGYRTSLAHLTVLDAHPLDLIDAAVAGGFDAIGLRIVAPMPTDRIVPVVGDEALIRRIAARLAATGIAILDVEAIWLGPDTDVAALEPALAVGARLGAANVLVVGNDPDAVRAADRFARLAQLAARHGLAVGLEFIPYCRTGTLAQARELLVAAAQPNAGLLIDALHLARSGGHPDDLADVPPALLLYSQICDARGPRPADTRALRQEARGGRFYPGDGHLPLDALLDRMPRDRPVGVEAPCAAFAQLPVVERGRRCGAATRRVLERHAGGGVATIRN